MIVERNLDVIEGYLKDVKLNNKIIFCSIHDYNFFNKPDMYIKTCVYITIRYYDNLTNEIGKDIICLDLCHLDLIKEFKNYVSVDYYLSILSKYPIY